MRIPGWERDLRSPGLPRMQYVESHNDDITELRYHPTRNNVLLSGSTDGLVNIYDTTIADEDETLLQVINHGSVHHAGFIGEKAIYALSHDELFSIHPFNDPDENVVEPAPIQFGDLRSALHCDYVVNVLVGAAGAYAATGSTRYSPPSCSHLFHSSLFLHPVLMTIRRAREQSLDLIPIVASPEFQFDRTKVWRLPGAHGEEVVRSVLLDNLSGSVFTCGEDGQVRVWRDESEASTQGGVQSSKIEANKTHPDTSSTAGRPSRLKEDRKTKRHKEKRYAPY
ncbi:hypothetical protein LOZ12_000566 [Ophidiomyces ophidiicola]|uniref:Uncharacterized protein n=1 Tax=Ophidiomyces ophidiicola TaxID=1387563 RepID=A0ACB8V5L8_9EURO|nr:hypothetical protein LOZ64_000324 [Ophidiomyces ophidiicola]KAI1955739.1 hypothetical protein LOZ62_000291 [Ophidiomyces ophidiicola]KAI1976035.1 hypothetical protein LOZ56_000353 [Ophidiomyces ophidiicola]KAI2011318.1 hypothetical protein LOZ50_000677 [Ophidiomyces ophidiicola]KAI2022659.1 hypothetical protein LOZ46_001800 [Ophidiomyces ophidiicola]